MHFAQFIDSTDVLYRKHRSKQLNSNNLELGFGSPLFWGAAAWPLFAFLYQNDLRWYFSSMMVFGSLWLHQNGSCGRPFLYYSLLEWSSNFRPGIRKIFPSQIEFVCGGSFFHCSGLWPPLLVKLVLHNLRPLTRAHDMSCWFVYLASVFRLWAP